LVCGTPTLVTGKKKVCIVLPHVTEKCHFGWLDANFDDEKCVHSIATQFRDLVSLFSTHMVAQIDYLGVSNGIIDLQ
jgi:hypothetical protein